MQKKNNRGKALTNGQVNMVPLCMWCRLPDVKVSKNKKIKVLIVLKNLWNQNQKAMWQKEKLLGTSNFSFCHNAFVIYSHIIKADLKGFSHFDKACLKSSAARSKMLSAGCKELRNCNVCWQLKILVVKICYLPCHHQRSVFTCNQQLSGKVVLLNLWGSPQV